MSGLVRRNACRASCGLSRPWVGRVRMLRVTSDEGASYLHIAYLPKSAGWLLPIITAVRGARSPELRTRANGWPDGDLPELGLAVSTKLAILPHVSREFQSLLAQLGKEVADIENLDEYIE